MENAYRDDGLLRRSKSVAAVEEVVYEEEKFRKSQPDHSCHHQKDSLLSWSSGFVDFSGLLNLCFLLLTLGGLRLFLENFIKYGILINPKQWLIALNGNSDEFTWHCPSLHLLFFSNIEIVTTFILEKCLANQWVNFQLGITLHIINLLTFLILPIVRISAEPDEFGIVGASIVCFIYSVIFLKLWSYIHVNYWCRLNYFETSLKKRRRISSNSPKSVLNEQTVKLTKFPDNLNLKDIYYFMLAPTLCYELNFPLRKSIRKRFLLRRFLETVAGFNVVVALFQQWIIPTVKNSLIPFSRMELLRAVERLLKLAIPNHLLWLIWFYLVFHGFLNLIGEILLFGDRDFYGDWWNSQNLNYFWRTWNLPVHRWAVRHLYLPLTNYWNVNRWLASASVFFISAFFHEYLVSVPLRLFKIWAFISMMAQLPLGTLSANIESKFGGKWGNMLMWSSVILGQPLCIMMYYHDYVMNYIENDPHNFAAALNISHL